MSMLLRAFGAERTDTLPVSEPLLAKTCTVHGGEITSYPYWFPGSASASSWGSVFSRYLP